MSKKKKKTQITFDKQQIKQSQNENIYNKKIMIVSNSKPTFNFDSLNYVINQIYL